MPDPSRISRRMSQSAIIQAIVDYRPVSRASVSKITGLSKQTVSEIVSKLEIGGWVQTAGQTEGHVGRRAVVYEMTPTAATVASVDLGGTKVRTALWDLTGAMRSELVERTDRAGGVDIVEQIARMVRAAMSEGNVADKDLRVVVVGVPGVPNPDDGSVLLAPNIPGIGEIDFRGLLRDRLGVETIVENDVNLFALGEHWLNNRSEHDILAYISVGTGLGAGIVAGGKLLRGNSGAAGEVGYLPFGADPFETESMKVGALERAAATGAIVELYRSRTGRRVGVPDVFDAAERGDEAASETLDCVAGQIARAAVAIAAVVDPGMIIVGGSVGSRDELLTRIREQAKKCFPRRINIEKSRLGDRAALAGGAAIALTKLHSSLFAEGQKGAEIQIPPPPVETIMRHGC